MFCSLSSRAYALIRQHPRFLKCNSLHGWVFKVAGCLIVSGMATAQVLALLQLWDSFRGKKWKEDLCRTSPGSPKALALLHLIILLHAGHETVTNGIY